MADEQVNINETHQTEGTAPELLSQAAGMGFMSRDEWVAKGRDPEQWKSPEEFVERAITDPKIQYERLGKVATKVEKLEKVNTDLVRTNERLLDEMRQMRSTHEKALKQQRLDMIRQLKSQQEQAVRDGDVDEFKRIDAEIEKTVKESKEPDAPTTEQVRAAREVQEWVAKNPWFNTDPEMHETAKALSIAIAAQGHHGEDYWTRLDSQMAALFPDRLGKKPVDPRSFERSFDDVSSGTRRSTGSSKGSEAGRSYNDLPDDAKRLCDYFVGRKEMTKDEYVKEYWKQEDKRGRR